MTVDALSARLHAAGKRERSRQGRAGLASPGRLSVRARPASQVAADLGTRLLEFGQTVPEGYPALRKALPALLASLDDQLPGVLIDSLREQWQRVQSLDDEIALLEGRLKLAMAESPACKAIADIPGVGLLTATATVATMGNAGNFRNGREFAAWLGLVPRHTGTGGKIRQLGISKRGDAICEPC